MPANRLLLLASAALLVAAPLAAAGDRANPEIADPGDDVAVGGGANCGVLPGPCLAGMDFFWHNADIELVWVNDTADALRFTMELRASEGFGRDTEAVGTVGAADSFTYTYTFTFQLHGHKHQAIVTLDDSLAITLGGVATSAAIDGRDLTVSVAKSGMDMPVDAGDVVGGLTLAVHGEAERAGITLDDRAPDANAGPDYVVANSPAPGNATDEDDSGDLKMPAPGAPLLALGLVALVVLVRRRA